MTSTSACAGGTRRAAGRPRDHPRPPAAGPRARGLTQPPWPGRSGCTPRRLRSSRDRSDAAEPAVLAALSGATDFPIAFFTRPSGPALPLGSLRFRARAAMTARQRRQAWWYAQTLYELMASMAAQTEYPMPRLPRLDGDPVVAAQRTREVWTCRPTGRSAGSSARWSATASGCSPSPRPLPRRDACSAAWAGGDDATPVIVVAAAAGDRRRFSVAHGWASGLAGPRGIHARAGAAGGRVRRAFLLPAGAMRGALVPPITLTTLAELKGPLGVAPGPDPARPDAGAHLSQSVPLALRPAWGAGLAHP